ncbi:hypothetical protein UFOVP1155_15 [uncultured Caudovirales phage]|uniref:Uncharacterized protein n=1 Tax=uncultured Caudovirales phage TaxID=2100421 RepID=A0A6J5QRV6_9CAUD|nr:hypothetical protein UFOVP1155_15 [uncultured Caudovirales phage]
MANLSPAPTSEKMSGVVDSQGKCTVDFPFAWLKWFSGLVANDGEVEPPAYTTATLPAASKHSGKIIFVLDAASGANFQGSNGTSWVNLG